MTWFDILTRAAAWGGFALGCFNSFFVWKRWRFDRENVEPEINIIIGSDTIRRDQISNDGRWVLLTASFRNVDKYSRTLKDIRVIRPHGGVIASSEELWTGNRYAMDQRFEGKAHDQRTDTARMNLTAAPAGSTRSDGHPTNSQDGDFYLFIPDDPSPAFVGTFETLEFRCLISASHRMRSRRSRSVIISNTIANPLSSNPR